MYRLRNGEPTHIRQLCRCLLDAVADQAVVVGGPELAVSGTKNMLDGDFALSGGEHLPQQAVKQLHTALHRHGPSRVGPRIEAVLTSSNRELDSSSHIDEGLREPADESWHEVP